MISIKNKTELLEDIKSQYENDMNDKIAMCDDFDACCYEELVEEIGEEEADEWIDDNYPPYEYWNDVDILERMHEYYEAELEDVIPVEDFEIIAGLLFELLIGEYDGNGEALYYTEYVYRKDYKDRFEVMEKYFDVEYDNSNRFADFKLKEEYKG